MTAQDQQSRARLLKALSDLLDESTAALTDVTTATERTVEVWNEAHDAMEAARALPVPENVREGEPYDDPAFEDLARTMVVWGTAQSALCAQFFLAGQAARTLPDGMEPVATVLSSRPGNGTSTVDKAFPAGTQLHTAAQVLAMGRVPPGWQAVPVDRTEEMKRAAMELLLDGLDIYVNGQDQIVIETDAPRRIWKAMLAAAPRPPAAQEPSSTADGASESIRRALHWIDADLRETMRDYLRRMASDDEFHKSVDQLEHILRQGLGKAEPAP